MSYTTQRTVLLFYIETVYQYLRHYVMSGNTKLHFVWFNICIILSRWNSAACGKTTKGPFNHHNLNQQIRFTRYYTHSAVLDRIQIIFLRLQHTTSVQARKKSSTRIISHIRVLYHTLYPVLITAVLLQSPYERPTATWADLAPRYWALLVKSNFNILKRLRRKPELVFLNEKYLFFQLFFIVFSLSWSFSGVQRVLW